MRVALCITVCLCLLIVPKARAVEVYSFDTVGYPDEAQARAQAQVYEYDCSPVFVRYNPGEQLPWRVLVGHFSFLAEANAVKSASTAPAISQSRITPWQWDGTELQENRIPVQMPFDTAVLSTFPRSTETRLDHESAEPTPEEASAALAASDISQLGARELYLRGKYGTREVALPSLELLVGRQSEYLAAGNIQLCHWSVRAKAFDAARGALGVALSSSPTALERSEIARSQAYIVLTEEGKPAGLEAFLSLANRADIEAGDRLDAMLRVGAIAIALRQDGLAWLATLQVESLCDSPKILAMARMRKASIAFDMTREDQSTLDEVRTLCQLAENSPEAPARIASTARLMLAEAYFKQGAYRQAIAEADDVCARYPDVARERATAIYWKARALSKLGRLSESAAVFAQAAADPVRTSSLFAGLNVKSRGLLECSKIFTRTGDVEAARSAIAALLASYPNSDEASLVPAR